MTSKDSRQIRPPDQRLGWQRLLPNILKDDEGIAGMPAGPMLYRSKVPGGWIVATGKGEGAGICYVPDTDHGWRR